MFHSSLNFIPDTPHSKSYRQGKYGRMFRSIPPTKFDFRLLNALAKSMERLPDEVPTADTPSMPAGYVYLGQFIAHDLTFDPSTLGERQSDPEYLSNFRTPALDLDSLYGSGPTVNPLYYQSLSGYFPADAQSIDLLRRPKFRNDDLQFALIPDPRNDENRIIAQIHLLFQKLHNFLLDKYTSFEEAKKYTQWHYQWLVINDFLPKIVHKPILDKIFDIKSPFAANRTHYIWKNGPFIPVEFSAAAYRFGHSTVRNSYILRKEISGATITGIFNLSADTRSLLMPESLMGFGEQSKGVDLQFFFGKKAQKSHLLEPRISTPLYDITKFTQKARSLEELSHANSLPYVTMKKGTLLGLPSGENVAKALNQIPVAIDLQQITGDTSFTNGETPLWYYILHEAADFRKKLESSSNTLGPVGSIIVGEVLIGLLQGDKSSYINQDPNWEPDLPEWGNNFNMAKLVQVLNRDIIY